MDTATRGSDAPEQLTLNALALTSRAEDLGIVRRNHSCHASPFAKISPSLPPWCGKAETNCNIDQSFNITASRAVSGMEFLGGNTLPCLGDADMRAGGLALFRHTARKLEMGFVPIRADEIADEILALSATISQLFANENVRKGRVAACSTR